MSIKNRIYAVIAISIATFSTIGGRDAYAQSPVAATTTTTTTTTSGDTTVTTTVINLSMGDLAQLVQAAANTIVQNGGQAKGSVSAAIDSTTRVGVEALRQIMKVDAGTAQALMSMIGVVADSVATASKAVISAGKQAAQKEADEASVRAKQAAQEMAEGARSATESAADSLKNALKAARDAIDALIGNMEGTEDKKK